MRPKAALSNTSQASHTFTRTTQLRQDNIKSDFKNHAAQGRVIKYFTSTAQLHAMLVKYVITRPSAALFLNHIFALSLCSCVVLVEVFLEGDVRTSARGPHPTKGNWKEI